MERYSDDFGPSWPEADQRFLRQVSERSVEGTSVLSLGPAVPSDLSGEEGADTRRGHQCQGPRLQKEVNMGNYRKARKRIEVSVGESVRIIRELQELSQNQLAELTGIPQSTISAIERNRVNLGIERAKVLARALKVHPAVLVFPSWDVERESAV